MTALPRFLAYAKAFEQTYADDDWSRLAPFFTEDVVYTVTGLPTTYELRGRDAMLAGMKKSVDGFDRKMERAIVPTAPPSQQGDVVTLHGFVRYRRGDSPPVELHARIEATFEGDRICRMHDHFTIGAPEAAWLGRHAADLDGSYT